MELAREAVSFDHLSRGHLVLGVGIGTDRSREFSAFGEREDVHTRAELLDEGLDIITELCAGEPIRFSGRHFHVDGVRFLPRPLPQPRIPIWCAAHWPNRTPLRRAARYDGVVPVGELPPHAVADLLAEVRRHRTIDDPFDVAIPSWTATSPADAYEQAGATRWLESFQRDTPLEREQRGSTPDVGHA